MKLGTPVRDPQSPHGIPERGDKKVQTLWHLGWVPPQLRSFFCTTTPFPPPHPDVNTQVEKIEMSTEFTEDLLNSTFKNFSVLTDSVDLIINMHKLRIHYAERWGVRGVRNEKRCPGFDRMVIGN